VSRTCCSFDNRGMLSFTYFSVLRVCRSSFYFPPTVGVFIGRILCCCCLILTLAAFLFKAVVFFFFFWRKFNSN
jgi:hypothetical protein